MDTKSKEKMKSRYFCHIVTSVKQHYLGMTSAGGV